MLDSYGRNINNMRISVTQQCNLDCFYCHHEGENGGKRNNGLMSLQEIEKIAEIGSRVGIHKVKITGGEPLLRNDIVDIVESCAMHMKEVSMTTNGVLLKDYAKALKNAGLKRVNVSFDAFDKKTFKDITRKDAYQDVREGIEAAIANGLSPVKLNMVVLKGINDNNLSSSIEYASSIGAILQLIEFETNKEDAGHDLFKTYHCPLNEYEKQLKGKAIEIRERSMHRRRKYILQSESNGSAEVEIVRGMHNSVFCSNCTRLRVTSDGFLKPCLLREDNYIDVAGPIRNRASDEELQVLFERAIHEKEPYWR
jgi:cyclic pyranopterin phosphate synthase